MNVLITVLGCLLGIAVYLLLSLVMPLKSLGDYAVGVMVALCLICVSIVGGIPWTNFWRKP
jgi:hypothetical protein